MSSDKFQMIQAQAQLAVYRIVTQDLISRTSAARRHNSLYARALDLVISNFRETQQDLKDVIEDIYTTDRELLLNYSMIDEKTTTWAEQSLKK